MAIKVVKIELFLVRGSDVTRMREMFLPKNV